MHTLLIVLIILLAVLVILLAIVAFVLLSAFFALQPILNQLGKISMLIDLARFIRNQARRIILRRSVRLGKQHDAPDKAAGEQVMDPDAASSAEPSLPKVSKVRTKNPN